MFLEIWGPDGGFGEIIFVKYGTIFIIDKRVCHAGGFRGSGRRMQFCFSEQVLDVDHKQIKSGFTNCYHNWNASINVAEVREKFT